MTSLDVPSVPPIAPPPTAGLPVSEISKPPLVEEIVAEVAEVPVVPVVPVNSKIQVPSTAPNAQAYIKRFAPTAIAEMRKFGVPASISLAQGLIESSSGTSYLARNANNHFGVKCFSRTCKKGHCIPRTDDSHKDFFRKYRSAWESWRAHSRLLSGGKYKRLHKYGRDYRKWAYGLKEIGYATAPSYARDLIGIIERYELYKYDLK